MSSETSSDDETNGVGRRREGRPSSSSRRRANGVWPEPFLESLAVRVACDAAQSGGRLSAACALANVFQVCSMWRAISRSELLWQSLDRRIWGVSRRSFPTWHKDYVYHHKTSMNFRIGHAIHSVLFNENTGAGGVTCLSVALSGSHLACGFLDGSVCVFYSGTMPRVCRFRPSNPDRLGPFSLSISGIVLQETHVTFASLDGNVYVGSIPGRTSRRALAGSVYTDGPLIDFTGSDRYWIGLFAGVPGRAFHIWNSVTEQIIFIGGRITDPEAVLGWRLLTEPRDNYHLGRVRIADEQLAIAVTSSRRVVLDLQNEGLVLNEEEEPDDGIIVDSVDVQKDLCLMVHNSGLAKVVRVRNQEEVCRFHLGDIDIAHVKVLCSLNSGYAFVSMEGIVSVWDIEKSEFLYDLEVEIDDAMDLVANDYRIACCSGNTGLHLWDFRAWL